MTTHLYMPLKTKVFLLDFLNTFLMVTWSDQTKVPEEDSNGSFY